MATDYYAQKLAEGQEYQDYVAERLYREGIVLVNFQSKKQQYEYGENLLGLEIKFDQKFATTGNLWIELEERHERTKPYTASGIFREDNGWLYGIGNYQEFFVFSKKFLQDLSQRGRFVIKENDRQTSRGFLLPRVEAARYADRAFVWKYSNTYKEQS